MGLGTWVQVTSLIEHGQGPLGIGYARAELETYSSGDFGDFLELVKQLRDVAEGRELARNYDADDTATELAAYGTALLIVRVAAASGSGGGQQSAHKLLRDIANTSDEGIVRSIIDEISSIARSTREESRAEVAAELVSFGRSII